MTTKIIVLTTDGDSREDGSVYYSDCIMVSSDTLTFSENAFDTTKTHGKSEDLIEEIVALGYTVERPSMKILVCEEI